jgi:hypothetical protein
MAEVYYSELDEHTRKWDPANREEVNPSEHFWVEHQKWLESCGYMLRPRLRSDWIPSWKGTKKNPFSCEDGQAVPATVGAFLLAASLS